jgi:hypothetical protein
MHWHVCSKIAANRFEYGQGPLRRAPEGAHKIEFALAVLLGRLCWRTICSRLAADLDWLEESITVPRQVLCRGAAM